MSIYHSPQSSGYGQPTSSDGLPLIQKCLQSRGISQTTQDTILGSWWTATQKQNQVYLEKWQSCRWEGCESPTPTCKGCDGVSSRILCKGFRTQLSKYCTKCPILLHSPWWECYCWESPTRLKVLKRSFHARPAFPRFTSTWDTSIVLTYLKTLSAFGTLPVNLLCYVP